MSTTRRSVSTALLAGAAGVIAAPTAATAATPARRPGRRGPATRERANTEAAVALLVGAFSDHDPRTAALRYIDPHTYVQHNPLYGNGRDAFIEGISHFVAQFPQSSVTVRRTVAQDDLVVVQTLFRTSPQDRGTAVSDTFRFNREGRIVEHWDVLQPIADSTVNGNPQI
ncbi:nuclear transport factor 2 family protein [Kineococcus sp. NUM-3379]